MNLVFKTLTIAFLLMGVNVNAQEQCSILQIQQSDDFILDIVKVDDKPVMASRNFRRVMSGREEYQILPGDHVLTFLQYPKAYYQLSHSDFAPRASAKGLNDVKMKVIHIKIESGYRLQLGLTNNSESATLSLMSQQLESCIISQEDEILGLDNTLYIENDSLPEQLDERLNSVMMRVNLYHQSNRENEANIVPLRVDHYFGSVIDDKYTEDNYIQVLSVLPFSIAAKFGLKSGDIITHIGNKRIEASDIEARVLFEDYLINKDTLIFDVIRDKHHLKVQGKKELTVIPGSHYSFDNAPIQSLQVTNPKLLEPKLAFDYDRIILELHDYYKSKNIKADHIRLHRGKRVSKSLGIKGKEIIGEGLLVLSLSNKSPMKKLGLRQNDIIVNASDSGQITDSVKILLAQVHKWRQQQSVSLLVKRNGELVKLHGVFQSEYLPGFTLTLDMNSEKYINEEREKMSSRRHWSYYPHNGNSFNYIRSTMDKKPNEYHINPNRNNK